ncbi:hypothetical protein [Tetragenococcus solitarius]|uniref:Uncharacterized protein n=1 Tax=Tetragenococcus solitarius TaxID=71453 RepID=A0ABP6KRC8_9ENTE|nr:hypothetical protein [Tetragenococcus solitarius]
MRNFISVEEIGLGEPTIADGLAVPRTLAVGSKLIRYYFSEVIRFKMNHSNVYYGTYTTQERFF